MKAVRLRAGLNAADAAQLISASGIKCTRGTLLAWERGIGATSREPFASDLSVIAGIYRCKVADLFASQAADAKFFPAIQATEEILRELPSPRASTGI
jgi:transcriptional regulator with XRE-family HTH domain